MEPAAAPVIPFAPVVVTVPLFVTTVVAAFNAIVPAIVIFAVEVTVTAVLETVNVPVFETVPLPSITAFVPVSLMPPEPLCVPLFV